MAKNFVHLQQEETRSDDKSRIENAIKNLFTIIQSSSAQTNTVGREAFDQLLADNELLIQYLQVLKENGIDLYSLREEDPLKSAIFAAIDRSYNLSAQGNFSLLLKLIDHLGPEFPSRTGNAIWLKCCTIKNLAPALACLEKGIDPSYHREGVTGLLLACAAKNEALIKELIKRGAKVDACANIIPTGPLAPLSEKSPIDYCLSDINLLRLFLKIGVDPTTPLGHTTLFKKFLDEAFSEFSIPEEEDLLLLESLIKGGSIPQLDTYSLGGPFTLFEYMIIQQGIQARSSQKIISALIEKGARVQETSGAFDLLCKDLVKLNPHDQDDLKFLGSITAHTDFLPVLINPSIEFREWMDKNPEIMELFGKSIEKKYGLPQEEFARYWDILRMTAQLRKEFIKEESALKHKEIITQIHPLMAGLPSKLAEETERLTIEDFFKAFSHHKISLLDASYDKNPKPYHAANKIAHFLLDKAIIAPLHGAVRLEKHYQGGQTGEMALVVKTALTEASKEPLLPHVITEELIALLEGVVNSDANNVSSKISAMQVGAKLLIPFSTSTHAVSVLIEKISPDKGRIVIYNTGASVNLHERWQVDETAQLGEPAQYQTFFQVDDISWNELEANDWFSDLQRLKTQDLKLNQLYEKYEALGVKHPRSTDREDYESIQLHGTCSAQNLMAFIRHQTMTKTEGSKVEKKAAYKAIKAHMLHRFGEKELSLSTLHPTIHFLGEKKLAKTAGELRMCTIAESSQAFLEAVAQFKRVLPKEQFQETHAAPQATTWQRYGMLRNFSRQLSALWIANPTAHTQSVHAFQSAEALTDDWNENVARMHQLLTSSFKAKDYEQAGELAVRYIFITSYRPEAEKWILQNMHPTPPASKPEEYAPLFDPLFKSFTDFPDRIKKRAEYFEKLFSTHDQPLAAEYFRKKLVLFAS